MTVTLLVDDVRRFADARPAIVCRGSAAAIHALRETPHVDELWLDYDLGGWDTIRPVLDHLEAADPVRVGEVVVHCSRAAAAHEIRTRLTAAGYRCRRVHVRGLLLPDR